MIRKSVWVVVFLMLAIAASPGAAFGVPASATMMPMHGGSGHTGSPAAAGCNCPMPMQATAAVPARADYGPRSAGGSEPLPCSGSAYPVLSGLSGMNSRVGGIRRIYPKNVLDHPERAAVYSTIVARPGIDLGSIASELGMNRETLRYHLAQLETATKVVAMRDRGIIRYYENHGKYTQLERKVLQHLWNPTAKQILALISSKPGITQVEITTHLAVTAPTVRWYVQRFHADGLVTGQHMGKYTHYAVLPDVTRFVTGINKSPVSAIAA